jgi:hypothetical protein
LKSLTRTLDFPNDDSAGFGLGSPVAIKNRRVCVLGRRNERGLTIEGLERLKIISIVQDKIGQQFRSYHQFPVVLDQPHCSEFVHEVCNT